MKIRVAKDGSGDFNNIQEAIAAVPLENQEECIIYIKEGVYKENIIIDEGKSWITLQGEGRDRTVITCDHYAGMIDEKGQRLGTNNSASVFINGSYITVEGITFENSYFDPGFDAPGRQAVAVNTTGEQIKFIQCGFKGHQDTLYVREGLCYFEACYIEGDIDFIFGAGKALFRKCRLHSLYAGSDTENGYIAAASTLTQDDFGFIFEECLLTADENMPKQSVYLGRPWHPSSCMEPVCSSMIFSQCEMGNHIKKEGWTFMGNIQPETERLFEAGNVGEGAQINSERRQISVTDVKSLCKSNDFLHNLFKYI